MQIKTAVVTIGATHEAIDPVRFIGNYSSGRQGLEITKVLLSKEAKVTLIRGFISDEVEQEINILANFYPNLKIIKVTTALEMLAASQKAAEKNLDLFMGVAAVCDFRPQTVATQKLKKQQLEGKYTLELIENPDIVASVAQQTLRPKLVVAFAAETEFLLTNARHKLIAKQCDLIVANDVSNNQAIHSKNNKVYILSKSEQDPYFIPENNKAVVAKEIVQYILQFKQ